MHKVTPFLWFNTQAEEATLFYVSLFKNSKVVSINRMGENGPVMSTSFELDGQPVMALNGGPEFKFNEAFSFFVSCETQAEVDNLWGKLTAAGGEESQCGWLKDKFGLSWQIVPVTLMELMSDPNPVKAQAVTQAMLKMHKIEVSVLQQAHASAK
jgi:predicted 3-demethylubiquinone-9 3-methyltransferase (glyoxalase superfamily)